VPAIQDQLLQNESLGADGFLTSLSGGRFTFVYQGDGNLVLYKNYRFQPRRPLWSTHTDGSTLGSTDMQGDGNLVVYDAGRAPLWASNTAGHPGSRLVVQDDGNVVIYDPAGVALWDTGTWGQAFAPTGPVSQGDIMQPGETLNPNQSISSANGQFEFAYQTDGNLVLYRLRDGHPLWASNTAGQPDEVCIMQSDGNLVIYDGDATPVWASNTAGHPGSRLVVQDDGNVVIYDPAGVALWATNTVQPIPPSTIDWPWAIILCQFNDVPAIPQPVDYYVDLFTRNGAGGVCDYWRAVSHNALDLTNSQVFGWFTMNHASTEVSNLRFPGDRFTLVKWGIDTANANGVNLAAFRSVLVVQNFGVDHGAAGNGILIVHQNATLCEFGFICHEMGHGFGLPHSFAANPDMEYGDGWDAMSFATTTFQFPIIYRDTQGTATVGLNARNLEALNALPVRRAWVRTQPDFSERISLDPLNQAPIGNRGFLMAKLAPSATRPRRPTNSSFTIELRRKAGWDRSIPEDAVLIHEVRANGLSYLQPTVWGRFTAGQQFETPDPKLFVQVVSIDSVSGTATVRMWDIPEGSLRREDSKPRVYLIENGTKRWITSPQALFALGKSWADVRVIPDGALNNLPAGQDVI
jgi:hypothetical protein